MSIHQIANLDKATVSHSTEITVNIFFGIMAIFFLIVWLTSGESKWDLFKIRYWYSREQNIYRLIAAIIALLYVLAIWVIVEMTKK
jgi:hypothetical protein